MGEEIAWWKNGSSHFCHCGCTLCRILQGTVSNCSSFIPFCPCSLLKYRRLETEEIQIIPFDKHTQWWGWGGGASENAYTVRCNDTCILLSGDLCTHDLINNWACRSKHPGSTIPIGIIRTVSKRLQCTQNHNGEEKTKTHFLLAFLYSFLILLYRPCIRLQWIDPTVPRIMVQREWLKTNRGSGENKNPKIYIYAYIYIFIFIYLRGMYPQHENTQNFKIGSLCFSKYVLACEALKKPLILIKILKNKTGKLCCPSVVLLCCSPVLWHQNLCYCESKSTKLALSGCCTPRKDHKVPPKKENHFIVLKENKRNPS